VPLLAPKHFENGLKLTNQNGNYFICKRKVLFCDEFTNYYDVSVGIDAFELTTKPGTFIDHEESGRALYLKVFLKKQKLLPQT
jgi:hypothetical protein